MFINIKYDRIPLFMPLIVRQELDCELYQGWKDKKLSEKRREESQ